MAQTRPATDDILAILNLINIGEDAFEGLSPDTGNARVFGGQTVAQSLVAAARTVDDLPESPPNSLHCHFYRLANPDVPLRFDVERVRDSKTFRTRLVRGSQEGKSILTAMATFHKSEDGFEHQDEMPEVPFPGEIIKPSAEEVKHRQVDLSQEMRDRLAKPQPQEARFVRKRAMFRPEVGDPDQQMWWRSTAAPRLPVPEADPFIHQAVLAYTSDLSFMDTPLIPHGVSLMSANVQGASIDHTVWFHEPVDMAEWHLFTAHSAWARHGRGNTRGSVFSHHGKLVATTAQECLIRKLD